MTIKKLTLTLAIAFKVVQYQHKVLTQFEQM